MVVHLSWELQERGSGSTVSLTFGYSSLRRSTMVTWVPEVPPPGPPLPPLAWELLAELLCEVIFPFTELSKYETPSLHFAFTLLLSAIWWWKKQKRTCLPLLLLALLPLDKPSCSASEQTLLAASAYWARALRHFSLLNFSAFPHPLALAHGLILIRFHPYNPLFSFHTTRCQFTLTEENISNDDGKMTTRLLRFEISFLLDYLHTPKSEPNSSANNLQ